MIHHYQIIRDFSSDPLRTALTSEIKRQFYIVYTKHYSVESCILDGLQQCVI
jgi:hypothetical protein